MTEKVALITGSGIGIGAKLAIELNKFGYFVVLTGRNLERLRQVAQQLHDPNKSLCIQADLAQEDQVDRIINETIEKYQRLDILVNNAGYRGDITNMGDSNWMDDFLKVLRVNVYSPARLCQLALPYLEKSDKGLVINVSSVASDVAVPLRSYSISKACLSEFTKQLAHDPSYFNRVRFITVSPGPIITEERPFHADHAPLTLLDRSGTITEVVDLMLFIITSGSDILNGSEIYIDGGLRSKYHPFDSILKK